MNKFWILGSSAVIIAALAIGSAYAFDLSSLFLSKEKKEAIRACETLRGQARAELSKALEEVDQLNSMTNPDMVKVAINIAKENITLNMSESQPKTHQLTAVGGTKLGELTPGKM